MPIREGRRVTAAFEERYQIIIPVGRASTIFYNKPGGRDHNQGKNKEQAFAEVLKEQMRESVLEENQTFQMFC